MRLSWTCSLEFWESSNFTYFTWPETRPSSKHLTSLNHVFMWESPRNKPLPQWTAWRTAGPDLSWRLVLQPEPRPVQLQSLACRNAVLLENFTMLHHSDPISDAWKSWIPSGKHTKTMERSTMLLMAKSTISTGPCSIAFCMFTRG